MTDSNNIDGTENSDLLFGEDDGETIEAGEGNDIVIAKGGDDSIYGGGGMDFLFGGEGSDTIYGGTEVDVISSGRGNDLIYGGEDCDFLLGGEGDDHIYGGDASDGLYGGSGSDTLYGGADDDWLSGGTDNDALTGGEGADTYQFETENGQDTITDFTNGEDLIDLREFTQITGFSDLTINSDGDDSVIDLTSHNGGSVRLQGVSISDLDAADFVFYRVEGGDGNDTLLGASGDDTLTGGAGDDTMTGYAGSDTFVFGPNHGNDTITDFSECEDAIDLSAFSSITGLSDLTITRDECDAVIDLTGHGGGTIRLADYYDQDSSFVSRLDDGDFVFYEPPSNEPPVEGI